MTVRLAQIAGRSYAVGLWWQPRPGGAAGRKAMLKEARDMAAEFEADRYTHAALRPEQYGLGRYEGPQKAVSLAAALRPFGPLGKKDAFLGVFHLSDSLWWVCSIVRGLVLAEGDQAFTDREEALAAADNLRRTMESGLMEVTLETAEESEEYLRPLLGPERPLAPLFQKEWDRRLKIILAAAIAFSIIGSGAAYWFYSGYQARQAVRQRAAKLAEKEARRQEILSHPTRYFRADWLTAPLPTRAGKVCADSLSNLPISVNGWRFDEASCRPEGGLTVVWVHSKGASFAALAGAAVLDSPQKATQQIPLPQIPARPGSARALLTKDQATAAFYDLTQNLAAQLTLSWDPPEKYRIDEETTVSAPWQRGQFQLTGLPLAALLGPDLFQALGLMPGAMIESLTRKTNDLTMKGYIYVTTSKTPGR